MWTDEDAITHTPLRMRDDVIGLDDDDDDNFQ
jgi:hypothetical protein